MKKIDVEMCFLIIATIISSCIVFDFLETIDYHPLLELAIFFALHFIVWGIIHIIVKHLIK